MDLLRIIGMFMIVSLHSISHGNLYNLDGGGINGYTIWFHIVDAARIGAVNVYILISGYFLVYEKFKLVKLWKICIETIFYSWIIFAFIICNQGMRELSPQNIMAAILPISYNGYWFISSYVVMYILSPIMNILIRHTNCYQHFIVIVILVFVFCIWSDVAPFSCRVGIVNGYSAVWFVVLYFIAAFMRKYISPVKNRIKPFVFYLLSVSCITISWVCLSLIIGDSYSNIEHIEDIEHSYYSYNSIFVLISSIALFQLFRGVKIESQWKRTTIKSLAPLTLGCYLIHDNYFMRDIIWHELQNVSAFSWIGIYVFFYVVIVYLCCLLLDYFRSQLFSLINKRMIYKKTWDKIDAKVQTGAIRIYEKMKNYW